MSSIMASEPSRDHRHDIRRCTEAGRDKDRPTSVD
jgi:hypothetical protein